MKQDNPLPSLKSEFSTLLWPATECATYKPLRISADITKQVFGKYHDFFIGMPPNTHPDALCFPGSNGFPGNRRPSPPVISGVESVMNLVSRSALLYDRPKTVTPNKSISPWHSAPDPRFQRRRAGTENSLQELLANHKSAYSTVPACITNIRIKTSKRLVSSNTLPIIKTRIFNSSISKTFSAKPISIISAEKPNKRFKALNKISPDRRVSPKSTSPKSTSPKSISPKISPTKSLPDRINGDSGSAIDDVVIKRVIKYCRNIDAVDSSTGSAEKQKKKKSKHKIYLSEGVNCVKKGSIGVPPCTPEPEHLETVQYVQCLADMKGRRRLGSKLSEIVKFQEEQKKKVLAEEEKVRLCEVKKQQVLLRVQQRNEIYALNKVMQALEERRFSDYCKSRLNGARSAASSVNIGGV